MFFSPGGEVEASFKPCQNALYYTAFPNNQTMPFSANIPCLASVEYLGVTLFVS